MRRGHSWLTKMDFSARPRMAIENYEKLTVTLVFKWKHGGEKPGWWRRSRLFANIFARLHAFVEGLPKSGTRASTCT